MTINLETIYRRLPVSLQNAACSWQGSRIGRRRYGAEFFVALSNYESRLHWSSEELHEIRDSRLSAFVVEASRHVPFYRRRFAGLGVEPGSIRTLSDLKCLPILTRQEAQSVGLELVADNIPESSKMISHTSGTTGTGLRFPVTLTSEHEQWAVWWRYRRALGIGFDEKCAVFGGRAVVPVEWKKAPFWRYNRAANQILFSGYHLKEENFSEYINELRDSGVKWLHGYPSHLTLLADYINSSGNEFDFLKEQVAHVTIGAESLLAHQRESINRAFSVSVRQHYGLAESVANISECPEGHLHVDEDFSAVEFVKAENGAGYRLIGTNFNNLAFPLLRYDTGDIVELSEVGNYSCGWNGRVVTEIDGRVEDFVVLSDGSRIGRMDHIFKDLTRIREAQIYQETPGMIQIRVVRSSGYTDLDEKKLLTETQAYCGRNLQVEVKYCDSLPRSKSGKLRFVISEVDGASIQVAK